MRKPGIRPMVLAAAILGLIAAVLAILCIGQSIRSRSLSAEVERQTKELSQLKQQAVTNKALAKSYYDLSAQVGGRFRDVAWDKQMPRMMNQLTGIMNANKIKVESLKPSAIESVDNIARLPFRIGFKSSLGNIARALRDMQNATPLIAVEQISIRVADAKTNMLQADAVVSCFAVVDKNATTKTKLLNADSESPASAGAVKISDSHKAGAETGDGMKRGSL